MDNYKYIEELLDKYWSCETDLEEETRLREFFSQEQQPPAHLQQYQPLFIHFEEKREIKLSANFEAQLLERMAAKSTNHSSRKSQVRNRISFFFKIAAGLLLLLSVGFFAQQHKKMQEQRAAHETIVTAIGLIAENLQQGETIIDEGLKQLEILFTNNNH